MLLAVLLTLGWSIFSVVRVNLRSRQVVDLLKDDRPEDFLREIDRDIAEQRNERLKTFLCINKSAGLCYVGRFQEARVLLDSLDVRRLPSYAQALYYNNLLIVLLHLDCLEEARRIRSGAAHHLDAKTRFPDLENAKSGTLAIYEIVCGDREAGKARLAELLRAPSSQSLRAFRLYYLAEAARQEGRTDEAEQQLRLAASLAPNSFIPSVLAERERGQGSA